jgi:hypothetical protein
VDDCNIPSPASVYHVNGTWNTNGKAISGGFYYVTLSGTKTLTLGASIFTCRSFENSSPTNFTFNYNTSSVILNQSSGYVIYGTNTFYNLTVSGFVVISAACTMHANQTVTNLFTITGANATSQRVLVQSNTIGTARTITVNGTTNITNCDFQDITLAGTANRDFSAQVDIGDAGGNSGITFPAPVTAYRVGVGNVSLATAGRTTSGGATQSRVPLPQDSAVIDANTGTGTLIMDCPRIGSIDMSAQNQAMTWALGNAMSCYGHYVLGTNVTPSGNFDTSLRNRVLSNLNLYNKTIYSLTIYGEYICVSNINTTSTILCSYGTLDFNDYNVNALKLESASGSTINAGNGTIAITRNTSAIVSIGGAFNCELSTIILNATSGSDNVTCALGSKTFNIVRFSGAHTGNFIITGSNTFADPQIDAGRKVQVTQSTTQTITPTGRLTSVGTSASHASLDSTTATPFNLVYAGTGYHQTHYLDVKSCNATANRFYTRGGTNGGGNTGYLFKSYAKSPQVINIQ